MIGGRFEVRGPGWTSLIAALLCAGALGCATNADVEKLRVELNDTRRLAQQAKTEAEAAAAEARRASFEARAAADSAQASAAEAKEATAKSERIFQKTLHK